MRKHVFILISIILFANCSSAPTKHVESLEDAVKRYHDYRLNGEMKKAFEMERMSLSGKVTLRDYAGLFARWSIIKKYEILEIGKEGAGPEGTTIVRLKITSNWPPLSMPVPEGDWVYELPDYWQKIDGKWYHVRKDLAVMY